MSHGEEQMGYLVVIEKASGNFSAYSPDVPGCAATGTTRAQCAASMREALAFHLAELRRDGERLPEARTTAEYVSV